MAELISDPGYLLSPNFHPRKPPPADRSAVRCMLLVPAAAGGAGWAPGTRRHVTAAQRKAVQRGQRLSPKIVHSSLWLSYPLLLLLPSNSILFGVQDGKWSVLALVPVWCGDLAL